MRGKRISPTLTRLKGETSQRVSPFSYMTSKYDTTYGFYTINISVNLTDKGNVQVWLPQFKSDARVDLNLRPTGGGTYIGRNSVDMCFYDGYSTKSNSLEIIFQDDNVKSDGKFYLKKTNDDSKELAYTLSLLLAGKNLTPTNGQTLYITDAASLETNWNRITAATIQKSVFRCCVGLDVYNWMQT